MKDITNKDEKEKKECGSVNHPSHYNGREDGIECIDVIRHYTFNIGCAIKYLWRAGLKHSEGKTDQEKEIEDLEKAIWYINDYLNNKTDHGALLQRRTIEENNVAVILSTGYAIEDIVHVYESNISVAMQNLLVAEIIVSGQIMVHINWRNYLKTAISMINQRIASINDSSVKKPQKCG